MLQFFRRSMENDLLAEAVKKADKDDTDLFCRICNLQKIIKKMPYFELKKAWKALKTKQLNIA